IEHRRDMLERVAAAHIVGMQMRVLRPVEVADERDALRGAGACPLRPVSRIEPDAAAAASLAEPDQELPLAASDLERRHPGPELEPLDLIVPDLVEKPEEPRRVGLGLLVCRRVSLERRIEPDIADEPAPAAEPQLDVPARKLQRLLPRRKHEAAVRRHVLHTIEDPDVAASAGSAAQRRLARQGIWPE